MSADPQPHATAMPAPRLVAVVGPTAAGKSDLAITLALAHDGEVINADAMQLYRGMDIGTAKLPDAERRGVAHHLLDVLDVTETATVAAFQRDAHQAVSQVRSRGRLPILVGGSGLYVHAVVDRWQIPGTDPAVRARLEADLAEVGPAALHARLAEKDPVAALAIEPSNGRRLVRALEVVELHGSFTATLPRPRADVDAVLVGLTVPRSELDARIAERVERMWQQGFVDEVRALAARGLREGRTASRALGYAQVLAHLAGECTEQEAKEGTVRATRRFARRQESWFRRDARVHWLPFDAPDLLARATTVAGT